MDDPESEPDRIKHKKNVLKLFRMLETDEHSFTSEELILGGVAYCMICGVRIPAEVPSWFLRITASEDGEELTRGYLLDEQCHKLILSRKYRSLSEKSQRLYRIELPKRLYDKGIDPRHN